MANIYCTKKLEKLVGKSLISTTPVEDSFLPNWNANLFSLDRRKCLIITNDETFYSIILLDILKKDILNLHEMFYQRLIEQLLYDKIEITASCKEELYNVCKPNFMKTNNNRKVLGSMNELVYTAEVCFYRDYFGDLDRVNVPEINHFLTNYLMGALKPKANDYGKPKEAMQTLLSSKYN